MDKKLLDALSNIGIGLDALVDALNSKEESNSPTGDALKGGDFGKQLEEISADIKGIKSDTTKILKNQETIIALSKGKEGKKTEGIEVDSKKGNKIKDGLGVILLIAVAVLAIGLAFKLVGKVDFLSVIALALAITILSIAFLAIASLDVDIKRAGIASIVMVMMSVALTLSSLVLSLVKPVNPMKLLTAILIGGAFMLLMPTMGKVIQSFKGLSWGEVLKASIGLIFILPAISLGIALSSYILRLVKPIGTEQLISAIFIGGVFVVLSFGLNKIIKALKDISPEVAVVAAIMLPVLFPAMSLAIMLSSQFLSNVAPISLEQFLTSVGISVTFLVLAYAIMPLMKEIGKMKWEDLLKLPVVFTVMSIAIMLSSHILVETADIGFAKLFKIVLLGFTLAIISLIMSIPLMVLGKLNYGDLLKGGAAIIAIATAIMISSHILGVGKYDKYPKWEWCLGVTLALIPFGLAMVLFGYIAMADGGLSLLLGSVMILVLAIAIMASSHILNEGDYEGNHPSVLWSLGVVAAILPFGMAAVALGLIAMSGIGAIGIIIGNFIILEIAKTVVKVAAILSEGSYKTYPSVLWSLDVISAMLPLGVGIVALGVMGMTPIGAIAFVVGLPMMVSIAETVNELSHELAKGDYKLNGMGKWALATTMLYATFTPILLVLGAIGMAASVVKFFTGTDPFETAKGMIINIAETIVDVSYTLRKGTYKGGPDEKWATGIAIALGAFSPVYGMLVRNSAMSFLTDGGVGPDDFAKAIMVVSEGIITAAGFFANNSAAFKDAPPEEWAKGVGLAIGAFGPVYASLADSSFFSSQDDNSPEAMSQGIMTVSKGIVAAADVFAANKATFSEDYPSKKWGAGVGAAISAFTPVFDALANKSWLSSGDKVIREMSDGIIKVSGAMAGAAKKISGVDWGVYPTAVWSKNVGSALNKFFDVVESFEDRELKDSHIEKFDAVFNSMIRVAKKVGKNTKSFESGKSLKNFSKYVLSTSSDGIIIKYITLVNKIASMYKDGEKGKSFSAYKLNIVVDSLVGVAKTFYSGKKYLEAGGGASEGFETLIHKNGIIIKFIRLTNKVERIYDDGGATLVRFLADSIIDVAKTFYRGKRYLGSKLINDNFEKVISPSGVIWKFTKLLKALKNKGVKDLLIGVDKTKYIAKSIVSVAKIFFSGKQYLDTVIDPNYMKNVAQNIIDFNSLVNKLTESELENNKKLKGFGSFFIEDPISKVARRMITLAEGYDKLATSLIKLGSAMRVLNVSDFRGLGGLTNQLINPNVESNRGSFSDVDRKIPTSISDRLSIGKKIKDSSMDSKLDEVIRLLSNIDKSTTSLDSKMLGMSADAEDEEAKPFKIIGKKSPK